MILDIEGRQHPGLARFRPYVGWILAGAMGSGFLAFLFSLTMPKVYRATTYLLVSDSKIAATAQAGAWQYALLPTFIQFVENDTLIQQAIEHFHLDQVPHPLSLDRFRGGGYLDVQIPKATRLLEIRVEYPDARLAADLANFFAQGAIAANDHITAGDTAATQKFLKMRMDEAAARREEVGKAMVEAHRRAHLEDKEKTLAILLGEKEKIVSHLDQLRLALAQDDSRAKSLQALVKNEPMVIKLQKSATSDRFLEQAAQKAGVSDTNSLSVTEESVNTTREDLQRKLADSEAGASAERAGLEAGTARVEEIQSRIDSLLTELAGDRNRVDRADRDLKLAEDNFESAAREYHNAALTVSGKAQDLQQVSPAVVPEKPVRPRKFFNTVLGFLLGLILFGGLAWLREALGASAPPAIRFASEDEPLEVRRH